MAGNTPEEAVDAFREGFRSTLRCITPATAYVSHIIPNGSNSLVIYAEGQPQPGRIRLSTHGGEGDLYLRLAHAFTIAHVPGDVVRGPYSVRTSFYQYRILDFEETELIAYDWHPTGIGARLSPHLHVSAIGSLILKQRRGSRLAEQKTYLGSFHLPTGHVFLEDIIELLISEFMVDPTCDDWLQVLRDNRAANERTRTW